MKTVYLSSMMVCALLLLVFPLTAATAVDKPFSVQTSVDTPQLYDDVKDEKVKVLMSATGEVSEFSLEDYLFGVVAAEMPALYEGEALKAQTVAAYTYYLRKSETHAADGYNISDDYTVDQAFVTPEAAAEKWGDGAKEYENKIRSAVKSVMGQKLTYDGALAATVYHAISSGKTENAQDVWGGDYPYLISVDSSFDKLASGYLSTVTKSAEEVKTVLASIAEIGDLTINCFSDPVRSEAGGIKTINVAGKSAPGSDVRRLLGLRSTDFDVAFDGSSYTFTVRGYGHGIGMSQNGANYMAQQGKTYSDILLHYYPGCKIE